MPEKANSGRDQLYSGQGDQKDDWQDNGNANKANPDQGEYHASYPEDAKSGLPVPVSGFSPVTTYVSNARRVQLR